MAVSDRRDGNHLIALHWGDLREAFRFAPCRFLAVEQNPAYRSPDGQIAPDRGVALPHAWASLQTLPSPRASYLDFSVLVYRLQVFSPRVDQDQVGARVAYLLGCCLSWCDPR